MGIRKLVDNAYNSDPRIARSRKEEMEEKAAKKKAKADQAKARRDEEERLKREAEAKEAEEKQKANAVKQEKEAQKKALKAERKKLRNLAKENNMFARDNDENISHLLEMEKMCEVYDTAQLAALVERLSSNIGSARETFLREIELLNGTMDDMRK